MLLFHPKIPAVGIFPFHVNRWTEGGRQVNFTRLWAELHGRTNGAPASELQHHCTVVIIPWQKAPMAVSRREADPTMLVGPRWRRTLTVGGEGGGVGDERTSRWILTDDRQMEVRTGEGAPHLEGSRPGGRWVTTTSIRGQIWVVGRALWWRAGEQQIGAPKRGEVLGGGRSGH